MKASTMAGQAMHGGGTASFMPAKSAVSRPIDLVHLSKYTLGNRSLETELLGLFRAQADVYVDRLDAASDDKEWKNAAHSLKGSARGLGAWGLADLAEEAERVVADGGPRADVMARIRDAVAAVKDFIDSLA